MNISTIEFTINHEGFTLNSPLTLTPSPQLASGGKTHFDQFWAFHLCLVQGAPIKGHGLSSTKVGHCVPDVGEGQVKTFL